MLYHERKIRIAESSAATSSSPNNSPCILLVTPPNTSRRGGKIFESQPLSSVEGSARRPRAARGGRLGQRKATKSRSPVEGESGAERR